VINSSSPTITWSARSHLNERVECTISKKATDPGCFLRLDVLDRVIVNGPLGRLRRNGRFLGIVVTADRKRKLSTSAVGIIALEVKRGAGRA
jgi:hypothetical protein